MLILLPPSETKVTGGGAIFAQEQLFAAPELDAARTKVQGALTQLCADSDLAAKVLHLGVKNRAQIAHNRNLHTSGAMPAILRYTGVLYDALDVKSLDAVARRWVDQQVLVQSALFGLVRAGDLIPNYRLSATSRLPALGATLKKLWQEAHRLLSLHEFVLDLRSLDYAALAPLAALGSAGGCAPEIVTASPDGRVRALNHFNKAAKGQLLRALAASLSRGEEITSVGQLCRWGESNGFNFVPGAMPEQLRLVLPPAPAG